MTIEFNEYINNMISIISSKNKRGITHAYYQSLNTASNLLDN